MMGVHSDVFSVGQPLVAAVFTFIALFNMVRVLANIMAQEISINQTCSLFTALYHRYGFSLIKFRGLISSGICLLSWATKH